MRKLFIVFGLILMGQVAFGAIIKVPGDQPTIQAGIDAAIDFDEIHVSPGTYIENIDFGGKVITVLGSGASQTILEPSNPSQPAVRMMDGEGEGTEFSGFTVSDGDGDYLVEIGNGANPLISQCIFHDYAHNKDASVVIRVSSNAMIRNNLFYNNGGLSCVGVADVGAASIINNTFDNNRRGFHCLSGDVIALNNIVTNSTDYGIYGSFVVLEHNCVWNNNPDYDGGAGAGVGSISVDPLYFEVASGDYSLDVSSPCIDAGNPDPEYNDPNGTRNDMGAYPFDLMFPVAQDINYGPDAIGYYVPTLTPEIYWSYYDTASTSQVEYEIEVGIDKDWSVAEMWATGSVVSPDTQVVYSGAVLENRAFYFIRIRLSDGTVWGSWQYSAFVVGISGVIQIPTDEPTIQAGIDAAVHGDTVMVLPGTYVGNIDFDGKVITVLGSGASQTILEPSNPSQPAVRMMGGEGEETVFSGFTVSDGDGDYLVVIGNGANPLISQCIFHGFALNRDNAVVVRVSSNAMIRNNLFYNNGGLSCVGIGEVGAASIINNTFDNNQRGFHCLSGGMIAINNIVTNSIDYGINGYFTTLEYNCVWNNNPDYDGGAGAGLGSISVDPLYFDPTSFNYQLDVFSPCIDAGNPDSEYNDPDGSRNDMGALTYGFGFPLAMDINYGPDAIGDFVPTLTPEIYWSYYDTVTSFQTGYEVEVGTDNDWSMAEMWATGPVASINTQVAYSGELLEDHTTYFVRIRLSNAAELGGWRYGQFYTYVSHTIFVPSEQPTIQAGIDFVMAGDTVSVSPGSYRESIDFYGKEIKVIGSGASQTVLTPYHYSLSAVRMMNGEGEGTEFSGFAVTGGYGDNLVEIGNDANPQISHCVFYDYSSNKDASVVIRVHSNALILYNLFYNNGGISCIGVGDIGAASIINNTFDNNSRGFHCLSGDVIALNNIITNSSEYGIYGSFDLLAYNCIWNNNPDYAGDASWKNVPVNVWNYYIGGYQVIKKWLSYREKTLLGRAMTLDEIEYVKEMARRLTAIILLQSELDNNYNAIKLNPYEWPKN